MKINDFRTLCPHAQQEIRTRAVRAVLSGRIQIDVAKDFGVSVQAICAWIGRFRKNGVAALNAKLRGTHQRGGKLAPWECAWIAKAVDEHDPEELALPYYLWSRAAVALLAKKEFGVEISPRTAGRYLKRWIFTAKVPQRRAYGHDSKEVMRWLKHRYPAIASQAERNHGVIVWADQVGLHAYDNYGRSYARRGEAAVVAGSGSHFGINIVSAITNTGRFCSLHFSENFRGEVFIRFLRRLLGIFREKIYLIIDMHPVHLSGKVSEWFLRHIERIRVYFLPKCSPELNPVELFNNDIKANMVGRIRPYTKKQLNAFIVKYLRRTGHSKKTIVAYFKEKHTLYAAASAIS